MRSLIILGELLPVVGTAGLLCLWFYQQTGVEQRSNELRQLAAARSVYQTYQSHNAVFNAIGELLAEKKDASRKLRTLQTYNYELGLHAIEEVLPESQRKGIPAAPAPYS